ncbi:Kinesin-like protein KIN-7N [Linum perenne]
MEKICVAVRVRPPVTPSPLDTISGGSYWITEDNRISLHRSGGTPISGVSYAFDHVFDHGSSNSRVYELLTKDIIHAADIFCMPYVVNRHFGETNMNARSSRSHTIFRMVCPSILTDAALLKRQKLEIEELRKKLQYELEREKLEMQLEEERKSQKEREQRIREQQMKIDNLSNIVTSADCDRSSSQGPSGGTSRPVEEFSDNNNAFQEDLFRTPSFKATPNAFVSKRSNNVRLPDFSPLPETLSNVADEDTWMKLNHGFTIDLDSIHMTPARKVQSFPANVVTPGYSIEKYKQEVQDLRTELQLVTAEKNGIKEKNSELLLLNDRLMHEKSELEQKLDLLGRIPQNFLKYITSSIDIYEEAHSTLLQSCALEAETSTARLLSGTREIGKTVLLNLENYISRAVDGGESIQKDDSAVEKELKLLSERSKAVASSEALKFQSGKKESESKVAAWSQSSRYHISILVIFFALLLGMLHFG